MSKLALRRTRMPMGAKLGPVWLLAKWRAGEVKARRVWATVNLKAWRMTPCSKTSSARTSPGKTGSPAASAEVQKRGLRALELRLKMAPESAVHAVKRLLGQAL